MFFKISSFLKFSFDLLFQYVFSPVNAWVLLRDEFRWEPDILGGAGICLGWVLVEKVWKCQRRTLCVRSCVCKFWLSCTNLFLHYLFYNLCMRMILSTFVQAWFMRIQVYSCICVSVLQFMHAQDPLYVCMQNFVYARSFLHTHSVRQKPKLNHLAHFLPIFHLFAILTLSFTLFTLNCMSHVTCHPIMRPISLPRHSLHLIMNLIPFSFCEFQPHVWVNVGPAGSWCGTPSWPRRLIHAGGFKPVVRLMLERSASAALVQTLAERWWTLPILSTLLAGR